VFTYQHYDLFNGVESSIQKDPVTGKSVSYAQIDLVNAEAQGKYIRFFEQAFEWEQMMYYFYPYFWGSKDQWMRKVIYEDRDSQFADFLKAGAARVMVPVRPGFERVLVHFMETGEIWGGGDLPRLESSTYLPLIEEIMKDRDNSKSEVPYGPHWKIKLPTNLVKLRNDGKLPKWKQNDNGEWVSEDEDKR
jgi:hypothetical protein